MKNSLVQASVLAEHTVAENLQKLGICFTFGDIHWIYMFTPNNRLKNIILSMNLRVPTILSPESVIGAVILLDHSNGSFVYVRKYDNVRPHILNLLNKDDESIIKMFNDEFVNYNGNGILKIPLITK